MGIEGRKHEKCSNTCMARRNGGAGSVDGSIAETGRSYADASKTAQCF